MQKKYKFKLIPEVHKELEQIAKKLPKIQKIGKDKKPLFRKVSFFKEVKEYNRATGSYSKVIQFGTEPVLVNHEVELVECYRKYGSTGVVKYIDLINSVLTKEQKKKEEANV